jgi:hypothetical protein
VIGYDDGNDKKFSAGILPTFVNIAIEFLHCGFAVVFASLAF